MVDDQNGDQGRTSLRHLPIGAVLTIVSLVAAVVATFFATRYGISSEIANLRADHEAKIAALRSLHSSGAPLERYRETAVLQIQVNSLRLIELELKRFERFVSAWEAPIFTYGKKLPSGRTGSFEVVVAQTTGDGSMPVGLPSGVFSGLVATNELRAIPSKDLVADLYKANLSVMAYNVALLRLTRFAQLDPMILAPPIPKIEDAIPRENAEEFLRLAKQEIVLLKNLLPGFDQRAAEVREKIEGLLLED